MHNNPEPRRHREDKNSCVSSDATWVYSKARNGTHYGAVRLELFPLRLIDQLKINKAA